MTIDTGFPFERSEPVKLTEEQKFLASAILRMMPKVDLHCHLDGSLRAETMIDLAQQYGVALPRTDPDELRAYMCADNVENLGEYLKKFDLTVSVMQTPEAIERIAYELVEDASHDNVKYIEVRNAPRLNTHGGLSLDEVMRATLTGLERGEQAFGTKARFIVCSLRHWAPTISFQMAELAVKYKDQGVVAFDLAGPEAGHPAGAHAAAFLYARMHDLHATCHAGEAAGPESIREALHMCGAFRIGHGVRANEDPKLVAYLCDRQILLEMCPTSNVQTHVVSSYETHPLKEYFNLGMQVSINTDNRLMSGVTLTDEYVHAVAEMGLMMDDLSDTVLSAGRGAFLPFDEKEKLCGQLAEILDRDGWYDDPPW
jgi:adenosine deaminase